MTVVETEIESLRRQLAERDAQIEDLSVRLTQAEMAVTNDWSYLDRVYNVVDAAQAFVGYGHNGTVAAGQAWDRLTTAILALDQAQRPHHAAANATGGQRRQYTPPTDPALHRDVTQERVCCCQSIYGHTRTCPAYSPFARPHHAVDAHTEGTQGTGE